MNISFSFLDLKDHPNTYLKLVIYDLHLYCDLKTHNEHLLAQEFLSSTLIENSLSGFVEPKSIAITMRTQTKPVPLPYAVIELKILDFVFTCDLVSDRQIRLASQLAQDAQLTLTFPAELEQRVHSVLLKHIRMEAA